jgi:leader peptidase (prepilin peptidase)/N-methyltransferase
MLFLSHPHLLLAAIGPLYLIAVAWPLARIDIREHRLPNRLVLPAFPIILAGQTAANFLTMDFWPTIGALVLASVAFGVGLIANRKNSLGMGDVKLIAAMALALGWYNPQSMVLALSVAFVAAGVTVAARFAVKKTNMGSSIALGPYLLAGFSVVAIGQVLS